MRRIILFSPNGYVGGYIREKIMREKELQLFVMTRDSDLTQYKGNYEVMVYSAAITSSRHETVDKYVQDNVVTAVSIIKFCKEHFIKRIIYLSSDEIYGMLNTDVITADAVMVNPNLYAATKYLAEKIIMESGIPYYILRLPGVVGRNWGRNFIYNLMTRISNNENIELYNIDRAFNNIVDVDDLTKFIAILCSYEDNKENEIFLLGNTEKVELKDIVSYIKSIYHSSSQISSVDADGQRYFTLDVKKAVEYGYSSKKIKTIIDELYQIQERKVF